MSALLVLYMVNQLLLPGHVEHVAGFAAFRGMIEGAFGPLSTQALGLADFRTLRGLRLFHAGPRRAGSATASASATPSFSARCR